MANVTILMLLNCTIVMSDDNSDHGNSFYDNAHVAIW